MNRNDDLKKAIEMAIIKPESENMAQLKPYEHEFSDKYKKEIAKAKKIADKKSGKRNISFFYKASSVIAAALVLAGVLTFTANEKLRNAINNWYIGNEFLAPTDNADNTETTYTTIITENSGIYTQPPTEPQSADNTDVPVSSDKSTEPSDAVQTGAPTQTSADKTSDELTRPATSANSPNTTKKQTNASITSNIGTTKKTSKTTVRKTTMTKTTTAKYTTATKKTTFTTKKATTVKKTTKPVTKHTTEQATIKTSATTHNATMPKATTTPKATVKPTHTDMVEPTITTIANVTVPVYVTTIQVVTFPEQVSVVTIVETTTTTTSTTTTTTTTAAPQLYQGKILLPYSKTYLTKIKI